MASIFLLCLMCSLFLKVGCWLGPKPSDGAEDLLQRSKGSHIIAFFRILCSISKYIIVYSSRLQYAIAFYRRLQYTCFSRFRVVFYRSNRKADIP